MTTEALEAEGVHRAFRSGGTDIPVLRGVDLRVWPGEIVTLAGPSGSGKSALFALLSGFDVPDDGAVRLSGLGMLGGVSMSEPSWRDCAVLPQAMGLAGELTVAENVALPLRLSGSPRDIPATVTDLLDRLGIDELADRYPAEISFGQQQRAALARAVSAGPKVLLADEPTAHLDHGTIPLVIEVLADTAARDTAVLIATHDPALHRAAHRRLRLVHGRIEEQEPEHP